MGEYSLTMYSLPDSRVREISQHIEFNNLTWMAWVGTDSLPGQLLDAWRK